MRYLVRGEFIEESFAGRTPEESTLYFQQVIKPSIEALWQLADEKKVIRGVTGGEHESVFVAEAESEAEVARLLRSLPFREAIRWTFSPIQSLQSALKKSREAKRAMRMIVER
jgi:hypothetical protein